MTHWPSSFVDRVKWSAKAEIRLQSWKSPEETAVFDSNHIFTSLSVIKIKQNLLLCRENDKIDKTHVYALFYEKTNPVKN